MLNHKKIIIVNGAITSLLIMFFIIGCPAADDDQDQKPSKPVLTYTLTKLNKDDTYKMPATDIRGIATSGDGEFLYVVGNQAASLRSFEVDKGKWEDALGDWKAIKEAADHTRAIDLSARKVDSFSTFSEGIIFTLNTNGGLVVLKGTGAQNSSFYPQNAGNFPNGLFNPFVVVDKDNNRYVVLSVTRRGATVVLPANGVIFRKYVDPPTNDAVANWDNTLARKQKGGTRAALKDLFTARTVDHEGNLLLAVQGQGIKRIVEADLGETNKFLDKNGDVVYESKEFMLDSKTKNDEINNMALVDKKFLIVGLKSSSDETGGVVITDLTQKNLTWHRFGAGQGLTVDIIATERIKNPSKTRIAAAITTDKGLLFVDNEGKIMELIPGKGQLVTSKYINDQRAESKDYEKATSGFAGEKIGDSTKNVKDIAQDKNGLWYVLFNDNLYKLDITSSQVEFMKPKPKMDLP